MPKVSVIMPVYNGEKYLKEAIDSILNQTLKDFELVIINDGSIDGSIGIVKSYLDPRIKLIDNEKNSGTAIVTNQGIENSTGEYIALMDADDISYPIRFQKQVEYLDKNKEIGLCGTWSKFLGTEDVVAFPLDFETIKIDMLFYSPLRNPTVMMRREMIEKHKLFYDVFYRYSLDYEFFSRCIKYFPIANIPEILLDYRIHTSQVTIKHDDVIKDKTNKIQVNQLKYFLNISPSDEEIAIHKLIMNNELPLTNANIERAENWLNKLKQANNLNKFYSEPAFSVRIDSLKYLHKIFVNNQQFNLPLLKKYFFSDLAPYKKFPLSFHFKFIFKCIIVLKTRQKSFK